MVKCWNDNTAPETGLYYGFWGGKHHVGMGASLAIREFEFIEEIKVMEKETMDWTDLLPNGLSMLKGSAQSLRDENKVKFRCSSLGKIMVGASLKPLPLTDKQAAELADLQAKNSQSQKRLELERKLTEIPTPKLSAGAKTYIQQKYYGHKFDFEKTFTNKFVQKGNAVEDASIKALREIGIWGKKNTEHFQNEWITGTPDIIVKNPSCIIDTKNVYYPDGLGFFDNEPIQDYIWQIHGYNFLTGNSTGFIAKMLMNPPADILEKEVWNYWRSGHNEGRPTEQFTLEIEDYFNFERMPIHERVKLFKIETTTEHLDIIRKWVELAREYWAELSEIDKSKNVKELEFFKK